MPRETRRTISVKGITYQRLKNYSEMVGEKMGTLVEGWVKEDLDRRRVPVPAGYVPPTPRRRGPSPEDLEAEAQAHFTF